MNSIPLKTLPEVLSKKDLHDLFQALEIDVEKESDITGAQLESIIRTRAEATRRRNAEPQLDRWYFDFGRELLP